MKRFIGGTVFLACLLMGMHWYWVNLGLMWALLVPFVVGLAFGVMWIVARMQNEASNVVTMQEFNEERKQLALARKRRRR